jgi:acyl carrier protein
MNLNERIITMNSIEERVRQTLSENLVLVDHVENINDEENLLEYGVNSMKIIQIIIQLENHFEIEFDDEYLERETYTIKSLVEYISNKLKITE